MTPEELDEARAKEAVRRFGEPGDKYELANERELAAIAARLAREGWTPPEPEPVVDSDILAFRDWAAKEWPIASEAASGGHMDTTRYAQAYLAGARMAREQERERARKYVDAKSARAQEFRAALAKYRGEA